MTTSARLTLLAIVSLTSPLLGLAQDNPGNAEKWHTVGPLSEVEDTLLYRAESDFGGEHYESAIKGHDLEGVEKWQLGHELPTKISVIVAHARDAFEKQFPQFRSFQILSVNLIHLTIVDDWIFNVEFNGTDFATAGPGSFEDKKINILVLLDGRVITPAVRPK